MNVMGTKKTTEETRARHAAELYAVEELRLAACVRADAAEADAEDYRARLEGSNRDYIALQERLMASEARVRELTDELEQARVRGDAMRSAAKRLMDQRRALLSDPAIEAGAKGSFENDGDKWSLLSDSDKTAWFEDFRAGLRATLDAVVVPDPQTDPLTIRCPYCMAAVGQSCYQYDPALETRYRDVPPHPSRVVAAREKAKDEPHPNAPIVDGDDEDDGLRSAPPEGGVVGSAEAVARAMAEWSNPMTWNGRHFHNREHWLAVAEAVMTAEGDLQKAILARAGKIRRAANYDGMADPCTCGHLRTHHKPNPECDLCDCSGFTDDAVRGREPKADANHPDPVPSVKDVGTERDCVSCGEGYPANECPKSQAPCGHHCNHAWSHDKCDWCGEVFGEDVGTVPSDVQEAIMRAKVQMHQEAAAVPSESREREVERCAHCGGPFYDDDLECGKCGHGYVLSPTDSRAVADQAKANQETSPAHAVSGFQPLSAEEAGAVGKRIADRVANFGGMQPSQIGGFYVDRDHVYSVIEEETGYRARPVPEGACDFCGQTEGHSKRCSVTKFGVNPKPPYGPVPEGDQK